MVMILLLASASLWGAGKAEGSRQPAAMLKIDQLSADELAREKLLQETLKLKIENEGTGVTSTRATSIATLLTTVLAIVGAFVTLYRQLTERKLERQQKLDEKLVQTLTDLGSDKIPIQSAAALSLETFLRPEHSSYHVQVFEALLANLRIGHDASVNRILLRNFERALALRLKRSCKHEVLSRLDLAYCFLQRVDLSKVDLTTCAGQIGVKEKEDDRLIDLKEAHLKGANLAGAKLRRARGYRVHLEGARLSYADLSEARLFKADLRRAYLHGTNLTAAKLQDANLSRAHLEGALLQSAHFKGANLKGACLANADLTDTYFRGAEFDDAALRSILRAKVRDGEKEGSWKDAKFDPDVLTWLKALQSLKNNESADKIKTEP
jgi:uncharacterized protein YjbI with pentapeptide repeats